MIVKPNGVSNFNRRLQRLVQACQNVILLEISCHSSYIMSVQSTIN